MGPGISNNKFIGMIEDVLLFIVIALPFAALFVNDTWMWLALLPSMLILAHFYRENFTYFSLGFFWPVFLLAILARLPWPLGFIIPLVTYLAVVAVSPRVRSATSWIKLGSFNRITLFIMAPTIIISSGALVLWVFLMKPDLSDLTGMVPIRSPWLLLAGGLLFSVFNAAWEEFILKGIMWSGLEKIVSRIAAVNIIQSIFFGLIHYQGFPRGIEGVVMASVYGFFIGLIRHYSGGMLAPVVTHFFADLTIFIILAVLAAS
jgi:membrane protease YdiL (CAAX protease family)